MSISGWIVFLGIFCHFRVNHAIMTPTHPTTMTRNAGFAKVDPRNEPPQTTLASSVATVENGTAHDKALVLALCGEKPKFRRVSFMTYMMRLKLCSVTDSKDWFDSECKNRTYAITDYYRLAYLKFCDSEAYATACNRTATAGRHDHDAVVHWWVNYNGLASSAAGNVSDATLFSNASEAHSLRQPHCREIDSYFDTLILKYAALSAAASAHDVTLRNKTSDFDKPFTNPEYTEWFLQFRPFCEPVACGTSNSDHQLNPVSSFSCFSASCRPAIVFAMVLESILAVAIVFTNSLVLSVAARTQIMRNIPGYFKVQLAVADLMVGVIVLPGSIYQNYVLYFSPLPYRVEDQLPAATDYFTRSYLDFMGVFTVLSFALSIYTMGAASVDRYLAITKPFRYRQGKYLTNKRLVGLFAGIWLLGLIGAIFPLFTSDQYGVTALSLILSTGSVAAPFYAVTIGIPLLAVWIINGMMLRQVWADGKNRRTMSASHRPVRSTASSSSQQKEKLAQKSSAPIRNQQKSALTRIQSAPPVTLTNNNNDTAYIKQQAVTRSKSAGRPNAFSKFANSMQATLKKRKQALSRSSSLPSQENIEKKLAKTLAVMVGAFTLALLPIIIFLVLQSALDIYITPLIFPKTYSPEATNAFYSSEYIAIRLFLSNSFWNCIIYSVRNRHFRQALADATACDPDAKRRRRRSASQISSRDRRLKKMYSTDSGGANSSVTDDRSRKSTQVFDISTVSKKDEDNASEPGASTKNVDSQL